jgi:molybdopterin/thiamine biosynthesis adenylyltransferase
VRSRRDAKVLVVGIGGLGSPAAIALAHAGVGLLGIADDDVVERSNLHRQILFRDADVGMPKLDAARAALARIAPATEVVTHPTRLLPHNAVEIVAPYDVVVEGSDNFATKFLTADACAIGRVPVVHAAAVRWYGTALAVGPRGAPCYRCIFEDLPEGDAPSCADAGVVGPVVGVIGALQADLALSILDALVAAREPDVYGELVTFDGRNDAFRRRHIAARPNCLLCGTAPSIRSIEANRYVAGAAACAS